MTTIANPLKTEETPQATTKNQLGIDNHKKSAMNLEAAAKCHYEAIKHYEVGNTEKACLSTVQAQGHSTLAGEAQREVLKSHTINQ